jgi:hypothetical protein
MRQTDIQDWRKIMNRMLFAEEVLKDIECAGQLPGEESDRIRRTISTIRGNRKKLEERFELEKDRRSKTIIDDERDKVNSIMTDLEF